MGWKGIFKKSSDKKHSWPQLASISPLSLKPELAYDDIRLCHTTSKPSNPVLRPTLNMKLPPPMEGVVWILHAPPWGVWWELTGCFALSINTAALQNGFLRGSCCCDAVLMCCGSRLQKKDIVHFIMQRCVYEARCGAAQLMHLISDPIQGTTSEISFDFHL